MVLLIHKSRIHPRLLRVVTTTRMRHPPRATTALTVRARLVRRHVGVHTVLEYHPLALLRLLVAIGMIWTGSAMDDRTATLHQMLAISSSATGTFATRELGSRRSLVSSVQ
jgi:hypothetical protein